MICKLYRNYETLSSLLSSTECATRTLLNLYNLHAVRGVLDNENVLDFKTSMSGPHHYFGWVKPKGYHVIEPDSAGNLSYHCLSKEEAKLQIKKSLKQLPSDHVVFIDSYSWISGTMVDAAMRQAHKVKDDELQTHLVDIESGAADSVFESPGILLLDSPELQLPLVSDPHLFDLSPYFAQIVQNNVPFAFNQELVNKFEHAQHKLRVVTYNYGDRYYEDYLMNGSGAFIERHEFIQAITPLNKECGGFVMLGREVIDIHGRKSLELVACPVPFGYTLLVDVGSIHGDSTLTGLYMMAMTGNHVAMKTADSVFLKHRETKKNVLVRTVPPLPVTPGLTGSSFLLTSD